MCDLESVVTPSMFNVMHSAAALVRMLPTLDLRSLGSFYLLSCSILGENVADLKSKVDLRLEVLRQFLSAFCV